MESGAVVALPCQQEEGARVESYSRPNVQTPADKPSTYQTPPNRSGLMSRGPELEASHSSLAAQETGNTAPGSTGLEEGPGRIAFRPPSTRSGGIPGRAMRTRMVSSRQTDSSPFGAAPILRIRNSRGTGVAGSARLGIFQLAGARATNSRDPAITGSDWSIFLFSGNGCAEPWYSRNARISGENPFTTVTVYLTKPHELTPELRE